MSSSQQSPGRRIVPEIEAQGRLGRILHKHLGFFSEKTIIVVGDVMLDRYISGDVRRISPEAPIPILIRREDRSVLGGAGNVAANIAALGARAILIGIIGDDPAGATVRQMLQERSGRIVDCLDVVQGRPTTVKTRFTSGGHQLLRLDEEETSEVEEQVNTRIFRSIKSLVAEADVVVLSDYAKGLFSEPLLRSLISLARDAGKPTIADPKRISLSDYSRVDVLTPNVSEIGQATGLSATDDEGAERAGHVALERSRAKAILVTRSEKGLTLVQPNRPTEHLPTHARQVADVSGAGDTLVAAFAVMLACKAEMVEAALVANVAAGLSVAKLGTATISQAELAAAVHRRELLSIDSKIRFLGDDLQELIEWREKKMTIGFTMDSIDLKHTIGLIRLLNQSHSLCDRLVVGLNADPLIAPLASSEPNMKVELPQATMIASTSAVDLVVVIDNSTLDALLQLVRPDFYFLSDTAGADLAGPLKSLRRYCGEIVTIHIADVNKGDVLIANV